MNKKCGHESNVDQCRLCRLYERNRAYRQSRGDEPVTTRPERRRRKALPIARPDRCQHFTGRTEFRPGCGGWKCKGGCTLDRPAKPGEYCQTCEAYKLDPDYAGQGTQGWMR